MLKWPYLYRVKRRAVGEGEALFWMGNRFAFDLQEISSDPVSLDRPGFWAVTTTFDGTWMCARFGQVREAPFTHGAGAWRGLSSDWSSTLSRQEFTDYVETIRTRIAQGSVYQVNACRELSTEIEGQSLAPLMEELLKNNPAPYASYLNLPNLEIASASPELFLRLENGEVTSGPIKGTKSRTEVRGAFGAKDVAENIMIVDLIRNDLGKVCEVGSVHVPKLLATEEHPGISHLVSYISGTLKKNISWLEISDSLLPPGSVSGAPKYSAVETIAQCEPQPRGPYCGVLGWVENGAALLSVAIRIFWSQRDGRLRFGTGAGITWGSDAEQEWEETELKAARLISIARGAYTETV